MRLRNYPLKGPEGEPGEYPRNPRALLSIISLAFACECTLEQFPHGVRTRGFRPQTSGKWERQDSNLQLSTLRWALPFCLLSRFAIANQRRHRESNPWFLCTERQPDLSPVTVTSCDLHHFRKMQRLVVRQPGEASLNSGMQSLDLTLTRNGVMFDGQGITKHPVAEGQFSLSPGLTGDN